jgi:hypothetical protein
MSNPIKDRAILLATAMHLSIPDGVNHMDAYDHLVNTVDTDGHNLDADICQVYEPYEERSLSQVLGMIEDSADIYEHHFKEVLAEAKAGIIEAAIDCDLPSDCNEICMAEMVARGKAAIES